MIEKEILWRKCSNCGRHLSKTEYCRDSKSPDKLSYWCFYCRSMYQKLYRMNKKRCKDEL